MKRDFSIISLSRTAWVDFSKAWLSWILLAGGGVFLMMVSIAAHFYLPEFRYFTAILLCFPGAIYTAILHQNGLDAAYGRKLSMLKISPSILFAALFFIAISLYNPFPEYLEILLLIFPSDFQFFIMINWLVHIIISYLLVRCMFVGMIILEKKCNVIEAFKKSFKLTARHVLFLFGLFFYLAIVLALSAFSVIGYFIILPYTVLLKSLLFKKLYEAIE
jgi:hypothetical protein